MIPAQIPAQRASTVFLATTALETCWDTTGKVIFLSEACKRYSRSAIWSGLDSETLPDPWADPSRRKAGYRYINGLYERTLPLIGQRLNEIHHTSHGPHYWRLVVGHWLYTYLSILFDRYTQIAQAMERFPGFRTVVLDENCEVTPKDTLESIRWTVEDTFNLQLYSRLLAALGANDFPRIAVRQKVRPIGESITSPAMRFSARIRSTARGIVSALLRQVGPGRIVLHKSYFTRAFELGLAARSNAAIVPSFLLESSVPEAETNRALRQQLSEFFSPENRFEAALAKLLPHDVPHCYLENFDALTKNARKFPREPAGIFSANSWLYDEAFKQWAANCREEGTMLLVAQHGGGYYGLGTYFPIEEYELSIADRFYTWGWRPGSGEIAHTVPMSASLLAARSQSLPDNRKSGMLYLATAEPRYLLSLQNTTGSLAQYFSWQKRFLDAISPAAKHVLRARLYPEDYGWDIRERWQDNASEVLIEDGRRPFLKSLEGSRLFISDHLGTTFYEAMAANHPTILFFDPDANPLRTEVCLSMDTLRLCGIVHETPESAAQAAMAAYPDVEKWWNDPDRQAAREDFCTRFARTVDSPIDEWLEELLQFVRDPKVKRDAVT